MRTPCMHEGGLAPGAMSASCLREANEASDKPVPRFVEKEIRRYLACGEFTRGIVHLRCMSCRAMSSFRSRARVALCVQAALDDE